MNGTIAPPAVPLGEAVSVIAVLTVLVAMFLTVRRGPGAERIPLWAGAWSLTFLHFVLRVIESHVGPSLRFWVAADYSALELSGVVFIASFRFPTNLRTQRNLLIAFLSAALPVHFFTIYCIQGGYWIRAATFGIAAFGAAAFCYFSVPRRTRIQLACTCALAGFGVWGIWEHLHRNPDSVVGVMLTLTYVLCAIFFWKLYRRRSLGVFTVTAGFAGWAALFPLTAALFFQGAEQTPLVSLWNVPRLLVALGMVLTVLEDNLKIIEQGRARAQAETNLLERLSHLKSRLLAGNDAMAVCKEVAAAVTEAGHYRCAALMLVGADGKLHLASSDGFAPESLQELRNRAGDDAIASFKFLAEHCERIGNGSFLLCAEQGLTLIPMISGRGSVVGCLCVAGSMQLAEMDSAQIVRLEAFASDLAVTIENMRLRQHLMRSEKLAAIGQLVAGVAHELNNPLTGILGYADLLSEAVQEPRATQRIGKLVNEAQRMKRILDGLLRFGRQNGSGSCSASLEATLRDVLLFREYHMRAHSVRVDVQIEPLLPPLGIVEDHLKQVLLNVLNNALDAIEDSAQREIRIRGGQTAGRIIVQFEDSGPGFADLNRAFDPFYTTKPPGKGTGLGLSICYGIVQEAGGEITISNLAPFGARVAIELPVGVTQPVVLAT